MKLSMKIKSSAVALLAAAAFLFTTSCNKDSNDPYASGEARNVQQGAKPIHDKDIQKRLLELKGLLPTVVVYNSTMDKYISLDLNNPKSFNFTAPSGSLSFSSPSGSVQFVPAGSGSFTIITSPASAGGGGGGGFVSAGDVTLEVNYVLCFATGDQGSDLNFFDIGPAGTGFGGAIGIAGNFEDLATMEFDDEDEINIDDFFQGIVAFYAFAGQPSGNYPVVDFFDFEDDFDVDESFFQNKGLAYFLSFQSNNMGIFFSKSGNVNFGGSSVGFEGTYYGVTNFNWFDFDDDEPDFVEVSGSGSLECGV